MDTGTAFQGQAAFSQLDVLIAEALQVHLNALLCAVIERHMAHVVRVELAVQFPVQVMQGVQVEGRSKPLGIVVGSIQLCIGLL